MPKNRLNDFNPRGNKTAAGNLAVDLFPNSNEVFTHPNGIFFEGSIPRRTRRLTFEMTSGDIPS